MVPSNSVLIVVTSHDRIDAEHATGLWLEEFAVPYLEFRRGGLQVTVASPQGGATPLDPNSSPTPEQAQEWAEAREALRDTLPLGQVSLDVYDVVFLPGGHGTMFDLPDNTRLQQLIGGMAEAGKIVAAVCHGPAGLVNVQLSDGSPLVAGKRLTAFTDAEEREVKLDQQMPFLLETRLRQLGADFIASGNWQEHTVTDGNLVTGQNPQSSRSTAQAVLKLLQQNTLQQVA